MSGKYALIIGNTEYTDPGLAQLTAPGKDVEDFARVIKDTNICAFDDVRVLLNELSSSVIEAIDEFFDQKKPDDLLVLYFSGHGVRDELGALYLATKNTIRTRLRSTAVKSDYIRDAMNQSRSKRQVIILDCCNSGAFPQGTKAEVGGTMGMISAFQGYGRYVLTASDEVQFAWEGNKIIGETDNSLFTHFLLKGLEGEADNDSDGRITVDELYDYAYEQISRVTPKQTPRKDASKQEGEIVLRQFTRVEDIKPVALPDDLVSEIEDTRPYVREAAVQKLEKILKGKNIGMARSAVEALEKITTDENTTRRVAQVTMQVLESYKQAQQKTDEERLAKLDAERFAEEKRRADENAKAERRVKEEADRLVAEKTEEDHLAKLEAERLAEEKCRADEKAEAERQAKEEAKRLAAQEAEGERLAKAKLEAERLAEEKRRIDQKAEAERKAREEIEKLAAQKDEEEHITKPKIATELLTEESAVQQSTSKEDTKSWFKIGLTMLTKPNEQAFVEIVSTQAVSTSKVYLWIFVLTTLSYFIYMTIDFALNSLGIQTSSGMSWSGSSLGNMVVNFGISIVVGILSLFIFTIYVAFIQWIAKLFKGIGSFQKMTYVFGTVLIPAILISMVISPFNLMPNARAPVGIFSIVLGIYTLYLQIIATKAVNQLNWAQASTSVIITIILTFATVLCVTLLLIGTAILWQG